VGTNALHLLVEDLDKLAFDRVLVPLSFHEHEELESMQPEPDRGVEVVSTVDSGDLVVERDYRIMKSRICRPEELNNELLELRRANEPLPTS
jgi:hypothetical protein